MIKGITRPFEIPKEMRNVAGQSVEQAKLAINNYLQAAQEAVSAFDLTLDYLYYRTEASPRRTHAVAYPVDSGRSRCSVL